MNYIRLPIDEPASNDQPVAPATKIKDDVKDGKEEKASVEEDKGGKEPSYYLI